MNELGKTTILFEDIKHIDKKNNEFWYARELQNVLNYKEWRKFEGVIQKAKEACIKSDMQVIDHFVGTDKTIKMPKGATKTIDDYKLSRYACYLIAQNGDSRKQEIALAQTYFAIQTRKQEISELEYSKLSEDEKRFDRFHNFGYKGLYNGETADDIAKRKGLRYREDILDNMGSEELAANLFRITQTEQKLKREKIKTEKEANKTHYDVGSKIRKTIKELGGTMPEELPTPKKSLKELEKEKIDIIKQS